MAAKVTKKTNTTQMQVRLTEEQYNLFCKAAMVDNRTLSSWARDRLEKAADQELKSRR